MARIREIVNEEHNSYGQFTPPNPWGHEVSVGREMEGGDDEDMQMDLQADLSTNPIPAFPIDEEIDLINQKLKDANISIDQFANNIISKLGYGKAKLMGKGTQGYAFDVGRNTMLKITSDKGEAAEAIKLVGKRNNNIGDFYKVFALDKPYDGVYAILREKLRVNPDEVTKLINTFRIVLHKINLSMLDVKATVMDHDAEMLKKIQDVVAADKREGAVQVMNVINELFARNVRSFDNVPENFGFKNNGALAYYDVGFSAGKEEPQFDTLALENMIQERVLSFMPKSSSVGVKKKCQLGGNGDGTSTACNQGDINALDIKPINETPIFDWMNKFFEPYKNIIRQELGKVDGFHRSDASDELAQMTHPAIDEFDAYHGTSKNANFDKFSADKIGSGDGRDLGGWGIYFTDSPDVASIYGEKIMSVDLRPGKYLSLNDTMDDELASFILSRGRKFGLSDEDLEQFQSDFNDEGYRYDITNKQVYDWLSHCLGTTKAASMFLSKAGYLGNTMPDKTNPDATNYIVFDPATVRILDNGDGEQEDLYELEWTDTTGGDQELVGMDGSVPMPNDSTYIPENLNEGKDVKVEYGAAMLYFKIKDWDKVTAIIDDKDVYDKPTFGREDKPHVTLLYGFHAGVTADEVKKAIEKVIDIKEPIEVELTKVSFFETKEDYDVVKFDVTSPILHKINKALRELKHTSTYPDYHPHMTISYVNKGKAKDYARKLKKSIKLRSSDIVYSTKKEKKTKLNENLQFNVQTLPFKNDIELAGGKIYSVGGAVRDGLLNKPSKDLDLLITGVPMDKLEQILSKYGKTDSVGKSFGIIKFNTPQFGELDIAIPRTEKANGQGGYQGFDVSSDHSLPIEKDLERRDFTINAMAKDMAGNMIDPYNGQQDLQDKMIRMVNPEAFKDDPLRMIRAVQFASRFGFQIEPKTMAAIKENAARIREISPERVLIEFDKIVKKGNPEIGAKLLAESGLYENIFGAEPKLNYEQMKQVKTMGEFIYLLAVGTGTSPAEFYKTNLKGDLDTYNEIKAYETAHQTPAKADDVQTKLNVFAMNKLSPKSLESKILPYEMKQNILQMQKANMPFSLRDLAINGNDLLAMGYTGQQIGEFFRKVIIDIYAGKLPNNREVLLNYITPNQEV